MNALVYSSSLAAAFLGGVLALFAPCCVVSLLPTFVGAALERGRVRLPVTAALFAAGVAAVLLPIVLGVGALGQVLLGHHRAVFFAVGSFLVVLGISVLAGRHWALPMPMLGIRATGSGSGGVFLLGVASGISSACCAPVLAGVVAMSALAASVTGAAGLGLAYVFGMVFPLLLASLLWDRARLGDRQSVVPALPYLRLGGWALPLADLVAGGMFTAIGAVALWLAVTGQSTYTPDALAAWNRWATGVAGDVTAALRSVPVAAQALVLVLMATGIGAAIYTAWRRGLQG